MNFFVTHIVSRPPRLTWVVYTLCLLAAFCEAEQLTAAQIIERESSALLLIIIRNHSSVIKGGLPSYSVSRQEIGRQSAKYVARVLARVKPNELPIEGIDKISLILNLGTAKQIGLTIPQRTLVRTDKVIK